MIIKISKTLVILLLVLFLSGCWDYKDVDKRSIVIGIGIERIDNKIEFSTEVAKLKAQIGKKDKRAEITNVYTDAAYGNTFEEAREDYDARRPYPTFLGATRVVIFGTNIAKESIEPYLNRINRMYDYRKTLLPVVSREEPIKLLKIKVEKDVSVGFLIEDNINFLYKNGTTLYPNIGDLLSNIALKKVGYVIPYIGIEQGSIKYLGLAVMKNSKLIDTIEAQNTDGLLYLLAENPRLTETISGFKRSDNIYSFKTILKDRKIKTKYEQDKIIIDIDIELNGQLKYQYYLEPISEKEIDEIEDIISRKVADNIKNIIKKSQKVYKSDIFQFARYFRADNSKIYQKIDWIEKYPKAKVNVRVKFNMNNKNLFDPNAKVQH
ncbi:Ger(x)C family spore germination protein [Dethiothermospora halolimnae]|uniref:Ger(x)C family spore germination protein n=1 Tax=Dethiothermospora halolimnae TaxID=3114390 RepID=UPI003CCB97F7